jgi:hypothetical protein
MPGHVNPHVFETENTIGTHTTYQSNGQGVAVSQFDEGICVAMSAVWCKEVLSGKRMALTKPSYTLASIWQVDYERDSNYTRFLNAHGMAIVQTQTMGGEQLIQYVAANHGLYMLRYPGHAMAAKTGPGGYYFFDAESGLWEYQAVARFEQKIWEGYNNVKHSSWTCRRVTSS